MGERQKAQISWENGVWPTTAMARGIPHVLLAGQNLWNRGRGLLVTPKGFGSAVANSGGVNPLLNVGGTYGGLTGGGSIVQAFGNGIYFFAGAGTARVGALSIGSVLGGTITIWNGSAAVQAGLLPPGAPTIIDSGAAGHNNGIYSIGVSVIDSVTGGESTISVQSNTISVANHGIKISALPGLSARANRIGIYVTKRGYGDIGPLFHLYDVAIPSLPYTIQVPGDATPGWIDQQLGDLAPVDYSVPPACTFVFAINSVIVAAGCYGGAGLSPSYPNKPEAYPVRFVVFVPSGAPITAIKGSGVEGGVMVCTARSIDIVTAGQSTVSPLNIRPKWPNTGVNSANQICVVGDEIYAWIGRPVRDAIGSPSDPGEEASNFAAPMFKSFGANGYDSATNIVVCYDPKADIVWFINGSVGISYNRWNGQWNLPMTMPASIVTAVTDVVNNRLLLSDSSGNLFQPETGSGMSWSLVTQMVGDGALKTVIGLEAMLSSGSCRADIYTDLNISAPNAFGANLAASGGHGVFDPLNIQDVRTFAVGLSGSDSGGRELYGAEVQFIDHGAVRQ